MRSGGGVLAVVLFILGVLALVVGIMYLSLPAHSLPSFFPGHSTNLHIGKHSKRGIAGIAAGVVLIILGFAASMSGRRRHSRYRY